MRIKVISMTEPWATLMAGGAKRIETRSWPTSYRGPLGVHVARDYPLWAKNLAHTYPFNTALRGFSLRPYVHPGCLIAVVDLYDCLPTDICRPDPGTDERAFGDYSPGRFAFLTRNARLLTEPIPARGLQRLWDFDMPEGALG